MQSNEMDPQIEAVASWLHTRALRLVLAESCTAGLVSASLARRPGVSELLCGSFVTYRDATKKAWLHVPDQTLRDRSAVSQLVTDAMACRALELTPEADLSVAITGHLGPDAPSELDGAVFLAAALRTPHQTSLLAQRRERLQHTQRIERQHEAAQRTLEFILTLPLPQPGDQAQRCTTERNAPPKTTRPGPRSS